MRRRSTEAAAGRTANPVGVIWHGFSIQGFKALLVRGGHIRQFRQSLRLGHADDPETTRDDFVVDETIIRSGRTPVASPEGGHTTSHAVIAHPVHVRPFQAGGRLQDPAEHADGGDEQKTEPQTRDVSPVLCILRPSVAEATDAGNSLFPKAD